MNRLTRIWVGQVHKVEKGLLMTACLHWKAFLGAEHVHNPSRKQFLKHPFLNMRHK